MKAKAIKIQQTQGYKLAYAKALKNAMQAEYPKYAARYYAEIFGENCGVKFGHTYWETFKAERANNMCEEHAKNRAAHVAFRTHSKTARQAEAAVKQAYPKLFANQA